MKRNCTKSVRCTCEVCTDRDDAEFARLLDRIMVGVIVGLFVGLILIYKHLAQ